MDRPAAALLFASVSLVSIIFCRIYKGKVSEYKQKRNTITCVLTGGPCAGKSSMMNALKENFEINGYMVLKVPEVIINILSSYDNKIMTGIGFHFTTL